MARKTKNLKQKVASLSALGAGALVFGAGQAEAGIIYSGTLDTHVGFTSGVPFYQSPALGPLGATFSFATTATSRSSFNGRAIVAYGCGCLQIAEQAGLLQLFNLGAIWTAALSPGTSMLIGGRVWGSGTTGTGSGSGSGSPGSHIPFTTANAFGQPPFDHLFSLFQFTDGSNTLYGWIQLSYTVSGQFGPDAAFGPELTIHDFAYDDSGALIAAGQTTDASQVPEPATAASTGLAALALGAVGLRQWRKARKAA